MNEISFIDIVNLTSCPETIIMTNFTDKTYSKVVHIYGSTAKATTDEDHVSTGLHSKVLLLHTVYSDKYVEHTQVHATGNNH